MLSALCEPALYFAFLFPEGGVPVEVHQALQAAMEKLQQRFTSLMQEKADLKERVEELEHRCIQLSGETDTIGETVVVVAVKIKLWLSEILCQDDRRTYQHSNICECVLCVSFQGST